MLFVHLGIVLLAGALLCLISTLSEYMTIRREWGLNILVALALIVYLIGVFLSEM